jgi:hypothetical protein
MQRSSHDYGRLAVVKGITSRHLSLQGRWEGA